MKKIKAYEVIIKDNSTNTAFVITMPARSKKEAEIRCSGNGEIVLCREIKLLIDTDVLQETLEKRFGQQECDLIRRLIEYEYEDIYLPF